MPLNLTKGQKINLSKEAGSLSRVTVGLGWDTNKYSGGFDFDLDVVRVVRFVKMKTLSFTGIRIVIMVRYIIREMIGLEATLRMAMTSRS